MVESGFQKSASEGKKKQRAKSLVKPEKLNVAISETEDGRTCVYCDYPFENVPDLIIVNESASSVYFAGGDCGKEGVRLQYPLEYDKLMIWKREEMTYFAVLNAEGAQAIYEVPVAFMNLPED